MTPDIDQITALLERVEGATAADLAGLTNGQMRHLAARMCFLCEHRLNRPGCSALYGRCSNAVAAKRQADCLASYKPRAKLSQGEA